MDSPVTIRDATAADANALSGIIRESFRDVAERFALTPQNCPKHPSNCTSAWIEADQARGVRYFLLVRDDEPIGCVGIEKASVDLCYLERLAVLPGRRRHGFGRRLALHVLACARDGGARRVAIGIIAAQTELKQWYAGLGFFEVETKRFPHLPFQVCLMELPIGPTAAIGS